MSVLSDKLQDVFMNIHNKFVDVNSSIDELFSTKADKADTLVGYGITDAYTKEEVGDIIDDVTLRMGGLETEINALTYSMNSFETRVSDINDDIEYANSCISNLYEAKANKTTIVYITEPTFSFEFATLDNVEIRGEVLTSLSFTFGDDEYGDGYTSGISFDSGETPTAIDYTDSGILNWVGTDCVTSNGLSIFQPSPNTHYDIVFYFNGTQFIGLVNGFVPANGNVVSE